MRNRDATCFIQLVDEALHVWDSQIDVTAKGVQLPHRHTAAASQLAALLQRSDETLCLTLQKPMVSHHAMSRPAILSSLTHFHASTHTESVQTASG